MVHWSLLTDFYVTKRAGVPISHALNIPSRVKQHAARVLKLRYIGRGMKLSEKRRVPVLVLSNRRCCSARDSSDYEHEYHFIEHEDDL